MEAALDKLTPQERQIERQALAKIVSSSVSKDFLGYVRARRHREIEV